MKGCDITDKQEMNELIKLLDIEPKYIVNYIADLIVENSDSIHQCIETYNRQWLESIIEKYIY